MKKSTSKLQSTGKLQIHRETLRLLQARALEAARGAELDHGTSSSTKESRPEICAY